jgi:hypothetical protein
VITEPGDGSKAERCKESIIPGNRGDHDRNCRGIRRRALPLPSPSGEIVVVRSNDS